MHLKGGGGDPMEESSENGDKSNIEKGKERKW